MADPPLPLSATDDNRYRFDPWDAIALHHIFRDPWERRIPFEKPPERDVKSVGDYPELNDLMDAIKKLDERVDVADVEESRAFEKENEELCCKTPNHQQAGSATSMMSIVERKKLPVGDSNLSWIIKVGGHLGEPLGRKRLVLRGPPENERKRSPSFDSDDAISVKSKRLRSSSPQAWTPENHEGQMDGEEQGYISEDDGRI